MNALDVMTCWAIWHLGCWVKLLFFFHIDSSHLVMAKHSRLLGQHDLKTVQLDCASCKLHQVMLNLDTS